MLLHLPLASPLLKLSFIEPWLGALWAVGNFMCIKFYNLQRRFLNYFSRSSPGFCYIAQQCPIELSVATGAFSIWGVQHGIHLCTFSIKQQDVHDMCLHGLSLHVIKLHIEHVPVFRDNGCECLYPIPIYWVPPGQGFFLACLLRGNKPDMMSLFLRARNSLGGSRQQMSPCIEAGGGMCWGTETMGDDTELDSQRRDPKKVMFGGNSQRWYRSMDQTWADLGKENSR